MTRTSYDVTAGVDGLTESDRHRLLAAEQRRTVLDVLEDRTVPVDLGDLARAVAKRKGDGGVADPETVERVARRLHHAHLPKMADLGVVEYDPATNRIEACPRHFRTE